MYTLPHTQNRFIFRAEHDAVVNGARTEWGKRKAEQFFARFLMDRESPMKCALLHPIAAFRYGRAEARENVTVAAEHVSFFRFKPVSLIRFRRTSTDFIAGSPLSEAEQQLIQAAFLPWGVMVSPDLYRESVQRAMRLLRQRYKGNAGKEV